MTEGKRLCGCGADCLWADGSHGPCRGTVQAVDEIEHGDGGWGWVHACERHKYEYWEMMYEPEK